MQNTYFWVWEGDQIVGVRRLYDGVAVLLEVDHRRRYVHVNHLRELNVQKHFRRIGFVLRTDFIIINFIDRRKIK